MRRENGVRILDRYILAEWAKVFGLCLLTLSGLILVSLSYTWVPDFLRWGADASTTVSYLLLRLVGDLTLLVPVSLLVSVIYILGQLNRNQELAAARAAGVSILRLTAPLWFAAVTCAGLMGFLNVAWSSASQEKARSIAERAEFESVASKGGEVKVRGESDFVVFDNSKDSRRWVIGKLSLAAQRASDVRLHVLDRQGREVRRIAARLADFRQVGERWSWTFIDGRDMSIDPVSGDLLRQPHFEQLVLVEVNEDPTVMSATRIEPHMLSFREVAKVSENAGWFPQGRMAKFAMRYHGILAGSAICLVVVAIAIPFAVVGGRTNPMVGVSKTLGLFLVYYFVDAIVGALGSAGTLPPLIAAWLPATLFALWAFPRLRAVN